MAWFLTESHRGYCMHFASAAVLLLRSMGVPARYVSGFVADVPASGRVNVPDSAAHAWVEVYIDGYGWEPVEVTPSTPGALPARAARRSRGHPSPRPRPRPAAPPTPPRPHPPPRRRRPSRMRARSSLSACFRPSWPPFCWCWPSPAALLGPPPPGAAFPG
ncbi:transglutaminase-like domain-containing protein [Flavonifractor plautii]|nr:transglutaminase-like domain-containing protein [Flavonifractor plautii]